MLNRLLLFFLVFTLLIVSACSSSKKIEPPEPDNDAQDEVLEDVKIQPGQSVDEYAEQEVIEFNEKSDERSDKYADVMEESEDEFDIGE